MSQPFLLKSLTLDLFVYDIQQGLGQDDQNVEANRQHVLTRIYDKLEPEKLEAIAQQVEAREHQESNYIPLSEDNVEGKSDSVQPFAKPWDGYYELVLLHDTYLTRIDSSGQIGWMNSIQSLDRLNDIRDSINSRKGSSGALGNSWMMWGQLTEPTDNQQQQAIADQCWKTLFSEATPMPQAEPGQFLGATLFEYWQPSLTADYPQGDRHLLVCLFPQDCAQVNQHASNLYRHLAHLWCYRHKILYVYAQSRQNKVKLLQTSGKIIPSSQVLPQPNKEHSIDLDGLQQSLQSALTRFSDYTDQLSELAEYRHNLSTNLSNAQKRLATMQELDLNADLKIFRDFYFFASEKYLAQVSSDHESLSPELRRLENTITAIEGSINIERARRDRQLNETIGNAGVWVGTASASASLMSTVVPSLAKAIDRSDSDEPSAIAFTQSLILTLSLSLLIGLLVAWAWKRIIYGRW